jgi:hypothetical protein
MDMAKFNLATQKFISDEEQNEYKRLSDEREAADETRIGESLLNAYTSAGGVDPMPPRDEYVTKHTPDEESIGDARSIFRSLPNQSKAQLFQGQVAHNRNREESDWKAQAAIAADRASQASESTMYSGVWSMLEPLIQRKEMTPKQALATMSLVMKESPDQALAFANNTVAASENMRYEASRIGQELSSIDEIAGPQIVSEAFTGRDPMLGPPTPEELHKASEAVFSRELGTFDRLIDDTEMLLEAATKKMETSRSREARSAAEQQVQMHEKNLEELVQSRLTLTKKMQRMSDALNGLSSGGSYDVRPEPVGPTEDFGARPTSNGRSLNENLDIAIAAWGRRHPGVDPESMAGSDFAEALSDAVKEGVFTSEEYEALLPHAAEMDRR